MPEGFRILQSGGDTRILENGNTRITQGYLTEAGASALTGTGTIAAAGIKSRHAASNLTGTGSIAAVARMTQQAAISISGAGSMASVALYTGAASWGGVTEAATRELESGDIRITEAGDTRIAAEVTFNTGAGFIVASATKTPFLSNAYYKQSGTWIVFSPFAKYESNWQQPEKISRYSSSTSTWKRIY
tara:strand:- start:252 stop:818 length:567 start_codon:yes stop_codon:yes gene_type:complete